MFAPTTLQIRSASAKDLGSINAIVQPCVMSWDIPERVKRLSLTSYLYSGIDLQHLTLFVAENQAGEMMGVAAIEDAELSDLPEGKTGMLLHGLFVAPAFQRLGVGRQLLETALQQAEGAHCDGLLVKAQSDAVAYFTRQGFDGLPVLDPQRDYPHRLWLPLSRKPEQSFRPSCPESAFSASQPDTSRMVTRD